MPGYDNGGGIAVLSRSLDIAATCEAPAEARRWLDHIAPLRALGQVAFDVRLLVSELVANSVRHAGLGPTDLIAVSLDLSDSVLRVEVQDEAMGSRFRNGPRSARPRADAGCRSSRPSRPAGV